MEKKNFGLWSCQNFFKRCYISAYSFSQVIKNIFFKTGFVIDNKPPLKKENSYAWLCFSWDFCRNTFQLIEEYI